MAIESAKTDADVAGDVVQPESKALATLGAALLIALCVGVVWLAVAMLPGHAPHLGSNPSALDYIIDNRWIVWLIRMSGLAIGVMFVVFAVYFVRSIRYRMRSGHWLHSGAGLQAEIVESTTTAFADAEGLLDALAESEARVTELDQALAETNTLLEYVLRQNQEQAAENERLRVELAGRQDPP